MFSYCYILEKKNFPFYFLTVKQSRFRQKRENAIISIKEQELQDHEYITSN